MDSLQEDYHVLRSQYKKLLEQRLDVRKLEDLCKSKITKLQERVQLIQATTEDAKVVEDVRHISDGLQDMVCTFPTAPSNLILQLILGDISVILPNKEDKVTYKQKYEQFKMVNVVVMFILSAVALFSDSILPNALVHFMSVWYYFTVILRELILVSNGSRIKWWWLVHHYCSILIAALLITWPPGECYQAFKTQFLLFSCVLSLVMLLQFRYQRAKLYRHIAMGKTHHLSISQDMKLASMRVLLACLISVYLFQLYNGYTLLKLWLWSPAIECDFFQVPLLSMLFFIVACMNMSTLSTFLLGKRANKSKSEAERHKSF